MKLSTVWDDGQYIWHYFTTKREAEESAIFCSSVVCVTDDGLRGPWRARVQETGCTFMKTWGRCNAPRWANTPYCIDHDHDMRRAAPNLEVVA